MAKREYKPVARVSEAVPGGTPVEHTPPPDDLGYDLIPKSRYTSEDYMRLEWERMWTKVWLLAGFAQDLA
ncbi:MAG: aromatic ring-hydroxylating dioxygenase subunit alpha, partial [Pseudomonadota bacterium]